MADPVQDFNPEEYLKSKQNSSTGNNIPVSAIDVEQFDPDAYLRDKSTAAAVNLQAQSGGTGQQILAGLEGLARGHTLGLSDTIESQLSKSHILPESITSQLTPEAIAQRQKANPLTSEATSIVGSIPTAGAIGAVGGAAGLGAIGSEAAVGAGLGAGNAISEASLGNEDLNAEKLLAHVGLGAVLGGGFGILSKAIKLAPALSRAIQDAEEVAPKKVKFDPFTKTGTGEASVDTEAVVPSQNRFDPFTKTGTKQKVAEESPSMFEKLKTTLNSAKEAIPESSHPLVKELLKHTPLSPLVTAYDALQSDYLRSIAGKLKTVTSDIASGAKDIFKSDEIKQAGLSAATQLSASQFKDISEKLNQISIDPDEFMDNMSSHTADLYQSAPNITQQLHNKLINGISFIQGKVPQAPNQYYLSPKWEPSQSQLNQFSKYYHAFNQPISALKQVNRGTLSNETMETLQAVHPQLLNQMQQQVLQHMKPEKAQALGYGKKLSLSKFLGTPLDESMTPQMIQITQAAYNPPAPQKPAPKPKLKQTGLSKLNVAKRTSTSTNKEEE